jgi:hypothetical protein
VISPAFSCLPARGGRLQSPHDAQAEAREADVIRCTAAFGHRIAGSPRPESSGRGWRIATSARRCTADPLEDGGIRALLLLYGTGRPPARSDRPAVAVRVIGVRGMRSCRRSEPDDSYALGRADLAVVLSGPSTTRGKGGAER